MQRFQDLTLPVEHSISPRWFVRQKSHIGSQEACGVMSCSNLYCPNFTASVACEYDIIILTLRCSPFYFLASFLTAMDSWFSPPRSKAFSIWRLWRLYSWGRVSQNSSLFRFTFALLSKLIACCSGIPLSMIRGVTRRSFNQVRNTQVVIPSLWCAHGLSSSDAA